MSIKNQISEDIIAAMKAKDSHTVETLRMIKTAIKNKEVAGKSPMALTDQEVIAVISTGIKQRNDSIEAFKLGNRPDLADREAKEITMLEKYMPRTATETELRHALGQVISYSYKASPTMKDLGQIIKGVQTFLQKSNLRADGKILSQTVRDYLTNLENLIKNSGCSGE